MVKVSKELEKAQEQFDKFDQEVKNLTMDQMRAAPKLEDEQQTKMSSREIRNSKDIYLKPEKTFPCAAKFNENFRKDYEFARELVQFIAENKEIIGEDIEIWTKKFPGVPYEYWKVPVNTPVWGPRYLAEQIKEKCYSRLRMQESPISSDGMGQYYGKMVVQNKVQRLDAYSVGNKRSVFV